MSCIYCNKKRLKSFKMNYFFLLFKVVYFDLQNQNLMSISVNRNRKPSIIRKAGIFQIIEGFSIKLTKNQLLRFNYRITDQFECIITPCRIKGGLINFSGPKQSFVRSADCRQRGTSESHCSLPHGNSAAVSDILYT